jgi:hypothetical protein
MEADSRQIDEVVERRELLIVIDKAIVAIRHKLSQDQTKIEKGTIAEFVRLLQLRREIEEEMPRRVTARWVQERETQDKETREKETPEKEIQA